MAIDARRDAVEARGIIGYRGGQKHLAGFYFVKYTLLPLLSRGGGGLVTAPKPSKHTICRANKYTVT